MYNKFQPIFVYILYIKFSWHSSFDFEDKMYTKFSRNVVYILLKFCIHFVHISCIHLVKFLYTKCIHSFRVGVHSRHVTKKPLWWWRGWTHWVVFMTSLYMYYALCFVHVEHSVCHEPISLVYIISPIRKIPLIRFKFCAKFHFFLLQTALLK